MNTQKLKSMLDADLKNKVVLVRMDHNVVKKGKIKEQHADRRHYPNSVAYI